MSFDHDKAGRKLDEEIAQAKAQADRGQAEWPPLAALSEPEKVTPKPFPFEAMGPVLGEAAQAIARDVQAPDSLVGGSVLAAAALAAQPHANVVLPHGQRVPLSLFVITGAASGDRKSAVDAVACRAIDEVRKHQARKHAQSLVNYAFDSADRKPGDSLLPPPTPQSLIVGNATVEGLHRLLMNQSNIGVFTAEGGEFLGGHSLREERRAAGYAFYLKAWSGDALDAVRGGTGTSVLLGRRLSMHIMVQPLPLRLLLADPLAQNQGLHARCLIAEPASLAGTRLFKKVDPNDDPHVQSYVDRLRYLLEKACTYCEIGDGHELQPRDLPIDDAATELWIEFYNEIERQQGAGGDLEAAKPFASKLAEQAARLAGVITLAEHGEAQQVGLEAMYGGICLARFYLSEHLRLTHAGRHEREQKPLRDLLEWLQGRCGQNARVAHADVLQKCPWVIRSMKAAGVNALLDDLQRRGYIRRVGEFWEVRRILG